MRKIAMSLAVLVVAYGASICGHCLAADGDITLNGTFVWDKKAAKDHPIKAVFTPNGDKKWTVVYSFEWGPKGAQSWKGTAEGDLKNGEIKGEGLHPDGRRKFTFKGTAKDGKIDCTHNETTSGKPEATGTMTLKKDS